FLTIYLTRNGHSVTAAATAVSAWSVGNFAGGLLGGWLADHLGRRHTIVLGTGTAALSVMMIYAVDSLPAIILWTVITGIANGTYIPANTALLVDLVPPALRVRGFAALRLAGNAGFACGAALGGLLATGSFLWLFLGDAITTLAYTCVALMLLPQGLRGQTREAPWSVAIAHIRSNHSFQRLFLASVCSALVFSQFGTTFSLYITHAGLQLGKLAPETIYGLLIGWNGVLVVLCELPLTGWTQRFDPRRVMAIGYVLLGGGFALNAFAHGLPLLVVAMTVFTVGEMISMPVSGALLSRLAPATMRGRYMGAQSLSWSGAGIIGPLAGAALFERSPQLVWFSCGALGLIGALILLRMRTPVDEPANDGSYVETAAPLREAT
ncbi:MAG TPA: MFS transporter, partial [Chthoniobacteraceae bacterium]|nr:MFS transporter [Chthoniobacteraceae bacterium]